MAVSLIPKLRYDFKRDCWMLGQYQVLRECERCGKIGDHKRVKLTPSRTLYYWDGEGEDPNRGFMLCRFCAKEHNEIMDEWWAEVHSY